MLNPYPYSDDNKRYTTWNYYLRHRFLQKVFKVPLDGGFTCPNRDGSKGIGGCIFCSEAGSGDFVKNPQDTLLQQFLDGKRRMEQKWPHAFAIPYFQSYSNTYGPLTKIQACIEPFLQREDCVGIAIATRADCLDAEKIAYLQACNQKKEIWVELGLQSIHDETSNRINRCHSFAEFCTTFNLLKATNCKICVHLINGLPGETPAMMLKTAKVIGAMKPDAIKIHMLHIVKNTTLAIQHLKEPLPLLDLENYVDLVIQQLEFLPPSIILQRLSGDGLMDQLIAPLWTAKKTIVYNEIDKEMVRRNTWQGKALTDGKY